MTDWTKKAEDYIRSHPPKGKGRRGPVGPQSVRDAAYREHVRRVAERLRSEDGGGGE